MTRHLFGLARPCWHGLVFTLATSACSSPFYERGQGQLLAPGLETEVRHWAGSMLTGERSDVTLNADPTTAAIVELRLYAIEKRPEALEFEPLANRTKLVLDIDHATPVLPASMLVPGARIGTGEVAEALLAAMQAGDFGRFEEVANSSDPLPLGTSRSLSAYATERAREPDNFLREYPELGSITKRVLIHVQNDEPATPFGVALFIQAAAPPLPSEAIYQEADEGLRPPDAIRPLGEIVMIEDAPSPGKPLAVVLGSPFESSAASCWLAWVEVALPPTAESPASEEYRAAFARAIEALEATTNQETDVEIAADRRVLEHALKELATAGDPRATLVYLASAAGAPLTEELALFASSGLLQELVEPIATASEQLVDTDVSVGWIIERATYRHLASILMEEDLSPAVASALLRHTGEAGRYASTIEQAAASSPNLAAFDAILLSENRIFLEDSNPGARVRAFDWLANRDEAPENYDPLGEPEERLAALTAHDEAVQR